MLKSIFITNLTDVNTTDKDGIGTHRYSNGKWYKYVKLMNTTATVAGAAGSLVGYFAGTGARDHRVVLDLSDADTIVPAAGALMAVVTGTLLVPYYVWIQLTGYCVLDTAVTSGAAGKSFFLSTTDKTGTVGANAFDQKVGVSVNGTTGVILQCPF